MTDVTVRDATGADVVRIRGVAQEAWQAAYAAFLTPGQCRRALDEHYPAEALERAIDELDEFHLLVAERDGEVVGFASTERTWADEAELYALYVHPDHWGEGVGVALLAEVEARVDEDVDRLACSVFVENYAGVGFFDSQGFERLGEARTEVAGSVQEEYELEKRL
jgi:ribosomal protein S18 acetylase RimI-like enzyme